MLSTNAKDIGTLYLIFSLFSGLLGTAFSVLIRMELSGPGVQYISDNQLYNSIITAHAILMIFFMVDKTIIFNGFHPLNLCLITSLAPPAPLKRAGNKGADIVISNNDNSCNNEKENKDDV